MKRSSELLGGTVREVEALEAAVQGLTAELADRKKHAQAMAPPK